MLAKRHLRIVRIAAAGLIVAVAGCESPPPMQDFNQSFGEAVTYNIAVQTVDPLPENAQYAPTFDGARTAIEMQRYRTDRVKQPGPLRTSGIGSTSGASGGSLPAPAGVAGGGGQ